MSVDQNLVQPYQTLRENLARRDRSLREKVVTLEEAASFVSDGATVGIGGSTMSRTPMAMIWQLIRGAKERVVLFALHHFDGWRPAARFGRSEPHYFELVRAGYSVGPVEGDAASHRRRPRAVRRMEPYGRRHALPRRRHGCSVHADAL